MNLIFDIPKTNFRREKIIHWANRYMLPGYNNDFERENELLALQKEIQQRKPQHLTKNELEKVVHWKSHRHLGYIRKIEENIVEQKTRAAFETTNICQSVEYLCELKGIRIAIASAILHLFHKDNYPIYDVHALRAVGEEKDDNIWESYVDFCRDIAKENDVDMRTLDRALFIFGYIISKL